ncbi:hypothetical protein KCU90_g472, partial [Aureobasidium melanogenum]
MLLQLEAAFLCDGLLAALDLGVEKFFDESAIEANEMVVMRPFVQFEHRLARFEIAAREQAGLLELRQHAIHGGKPDIEFFVQKVAVDVFCG